MATSSLAHNRHLLFETLAARAHEAGMAAGRAAEVAPMVVRQHANPLNDASPVTQQWVVPGGPCGFAWVWFKGNTAWARWARKAGLARSAYPNGLMVWVGEFNQSMARKEAYARAYADVLSGAGITAYAQSRMD